MPSCASPRLALRPFRAPLQPGGVQTGLATVRSGGARRSGLYSKPHAAAVVPTDAQRPLRSPKQPSRQDPSKLVPSACV